MAFKFVHTADWQIGKPYLQFDAEKRGELRRARLEVIERIARAAQSAGARHALVAGDVFDSEAVAFQPALGELSRFPAVTWHLLPGNHDPHRPGGIWDRIMDGRVPSNVVCHLEPEPREIDSDVWLLPAPFCGRSTGDPTLWMDRCSTPEGALRIGLAHGEVRGFGGEGESGILIDPIRAEAARLDYLALGDCHGKTRIDDRTWYPGTPEMDRFPRNEPGQVLIVEIERSGGRPHVGEHRTSHFRWLRRNLRVTSPGEVVALAQALLADAHPPMRTLLRLELAGDLSLSDHAAVEVAVGGLESRLFHVRRRLDALQAHAEIGDLDAFDDAGLREAAERLDRVASESQDKERARIAALALRRLYGFARASGGVE